MHKMRNLLNYKWFFYAIFYVISTPHELKNVKLKAPHRYAKVLSINGWFLISKLTWPWPQCVQKINSFGPLMEEKTYFVRVRKIMFFWKWGYVWSKWLEISIFLSNELQESEHVSKRYDGPMMAGHLQWFFWHGKSHRYCDQLRSYFLAVF